MTHFIANLLAGITFIGFIVAANATEPGEHSATPQILSSINSAGCKPLNDVEMSKVTGGVTFPNGPYFMSSGFITYPVYISLVDQAKNLYSVKPNPRVLSQGNPGTTNQVEPPRFQARAITPEETNVAAATGRADISAAIGRR